MCIRDRASTIELGWNAGSGHETHGHPLQRISALEGGDAGVAVVHGNPPGLTEIGNLHVTQSVSYTHLDVYKRQRDDCLNHSLRLVRILNRNAINSCFFGRIVIPSDIQGIADVNHLFQ